MRDTATAMPSDLLRIADLDADQLGALLDLAREMKRDPKGWCHDHLAEVLACYFSEPSTRTRASFEAAAWRLGMLPTMLRADALRLAGGERIGDTARVISAYAAAVVVSTSDHGKLSEMARAASVPVINGVTESHHPCQALADLLTLRNRFGELGGLKVAYIGEGNNVAHSLMEAGALVGMHVVVATPHRYEPDVQITMLAHDLARQHGGSVEVTNDIFRAVTGANVVYAGAWVSIGEESAYDKRPAEMRNYQVNTDVMSQAWSDAVFMHCLPEHRGAEVTAEVIEGPQSVVFEQAGNRVPTEQAVIHALVSDPTTQDRHQCLPSRAHAPI